jgi:hypothetical protein
MWSSWSLLVVVVVVGIITRVAVEQVVYLLAFRA